MHSELRRLCLAHQGDLDTLAIQFHFPEDLDRKIGWTLHFHRSDRVVTPHFNGSHNRVIRMVGWFEPVPPKNPFYSPPEIPGA